MTSGITMLFTCSLLYLHVAKASVITELENTVQQREVLPSFHTTRSAPETWSVAFAPDQSYFAWSCGNRIVKLIPWDKEKHNM